MPTLGILHATKYNNLPLFFGLTRIFYQVGTRAFDALESQATPDTRFGGAGGYGSAYGKMYQERFWKQSYFDAVQVVPAPPNTCHKVFQQAAAN